MTLRLPCARILLSILGLLLTLPQLSAQAGTGWIEGRVSHPATGEFIEGARIAVEGTGLETASDADGNYRLADVPAGTARVRAFYTGLPVQLASVVVTAGQTATLDIRFAPPPAAAAAPGSIVKLEEFVVSTSREMTAAALAINEQRFAANLKNVVAADEFGDVAEGNVAEFIKFLPGVNIDYAGGNAREVSLNGVPADYVPVTISGFSLASAVGGGGGGTNRAAGLDQVSINNLSRIEVEYSPTPDSQGNALGGSVNMIPRSSFERAKPLLNFSTYLMMRDDARDWKRTPAPRHPTRKIHPGADFSYVNPVNKNFGFTVSGGFSRQYSGEPQAQLTWRGTQAVTNGNAYPHTPIGQPYLTAFLVRNSGKDTKRSALGFTIDYRLGRHDRLSFGLQTSTFDVNINHNALTFEVGRVAAGAYSLQHTQGSAGAGSLQLVTTGASRYNWTYMPTLSWRHEGNVWKAEGGVGLSRARNRSYATNAGFFDTTTSRRTGVTVGFSDIFYLRPGVITVTDAAGQPVNPYSLSSYVITAAGGNERGTDDTERTAYASLRRDFSGRIPFPLRTGLDLRDSVRDQRLDTPDYNYVGRDGVASTAPSATSDDLAAPFLDPSYSSRIAPYGFPAIEGVSSEKLYEHFLANPANFSTAATANANYRARITNSKVASELISAAYLRGDLSLLQHRLKLVGGVRLEQTNIEASGPLSDASLNVQRDAQGRPILGANGRPLPLVPANDALGVSRLTYLDRGAHTEKEYLRWFPSINASYTVRENLIARAAWSESIGRPDFAQYSGGVTLPDPLNPSPSDQITVSNVGIKPWTARSINVRLEYYLQGVGQISVGAFRRDFTNFFGSTTLEATPEFLSLYNLDPNTYGQYPVVTQYNVSSTVRMQGLSVNYRQPLTFLPSWARGLQVFANGNSQRMLGDAGSANFPAFIPRTASWGLSLTRPKYTLRANWNYRSLQRRALLAAGASREPGTYTWWSKRLYLDLNGEYTFYRRLSVFANLRNVGDAPDDVKVYGPSTPAVARFRQRIHFGSLWMFGVKGTF
ncbi:MAG: TonB-dependent receptor [Verrucomicrobia bacterium]|nr:TonB-dependent receptor [Verrucomicrobiota bacterium]